LEEESAGVHELGGHEDGAAAGGGEARGEVFVAEAAEDGDVGFIAFGDGRRWELEVHETVVADEGDEVEFAGGGGGFEVLEALLDLGAAVGVGDEIEVGGGVVEGETAEDGGGDVFAGIGDLPELAAWEERAEAVGAAPVEIGVGGVAVADFFADGDDALGFVIAEGDEDADLFRGGVGGEGG